MGKFYLAGTFVCSVIGDNFFVYIRKQPFLEVHKRANPSKMVGLPTLTPKQKVTRNPLCILKFKVSLKTVINNLGKKKCKYNKIFCGGQLFSKFHLHKLRNKGAGDDLRCSKSFGVNFLKTRTFGMARFYLKVIK